MTQEQSEDTGNRIEDLEPWQMRVLLIVGAGLLVAYSTVPAPASCTAFDTAAPAWCTHPMPSLLAAGVLLFVAVTL